MNDALTYTFWQFTSALTEWVSPAIVNRERCEIFSLYCTGYTVPEVAKYLKAKLREPML